MITMAELHQGVAMAKDAATRAARTEMLGAVLVEFDPLPLDAEAATRYGALVALALEAKQDSRPHRIDLMNRGRRVRPRSCSLHTQRNRFQRPA